jgi:hypothetical protein
LKARIGRTYQEPYKSFNERTGKWRVPWMTLNKTQRLKRYRRALVASKNGLRIPQDLTFAEYDREQRELDLHQRSPSRTRWPIKTEPKQNRSAKNALPHLFGRGGSDRVLICLALNGPLTVRELARTLKVDSHGAFKMVDRLREAGLVVKRDLTHGRKYVAINRNLLIYRPLMRLLHALERIAPVQRRPATIARWHMPFDRIMTDYRLDRIFQSPPRSRILLFVGAVGETDLQTIYRSLGLGTVSASLIVDHWQKQHVLRCRYYKSHRLISLDPGFVAANELRALLRQIVACSGEYRAFRKTVRRRLADITRSAGPWENTPKIRRR